MLGADSLSYTSFSKYLGGIGRRDGTVRSTVNKSVITNCTATAVQVLSPATHLNNVSVVYLSNRGGWS
jgi:hypothetical protein